MDERMEEIKPISRVCPVRKVVLVRPGRRHREIMYQINQKDQKSKKIKLDPEKIPNVSKTTDSSTVPNSNDFVADLKKRIAFDRARIMGD